jgi:pyocin large subunit-like protein
MRSVRVVIGLLLVALLVLAQGPGFRSRRQFDEHYAKHGREFGNISQGEYLHRAQALRDAPLGGPILEAVKAGGIITRFDRRTGAFGAYNSDRTIRTFFIPNNGERYFHRQATRPEDD